MTRLRRFSFIRVESLESRETPASAVWTPGGTNVNWSNPNNWLIDGTIKAVPATGDDVQISTGTSVTFDVNAGTVTLNSLNSSLPFTMQGGSLTVNNAVGAGNFTAPVTVLGGKLSGLGTMNFQSTVNMQGGSLSPIGTANFSSTVTLSGGVFGDSGVSNIQGGMGMSGGVLAGSGTISFTSQLAMSGGSMQGPGTTNFATATATWLINSSSQSISLNNRTIDSVGQITWTGTAPLLTNDGSLTVHTIGGRFNINTGAPLLFNTAVPGSQAAIPITLSSGGSLFVNAATQIASSISADTGNITVGGDAQFLGPVTLGGQWHANSDFTLAGGGNLFGVIDGVGVISLINGTFNIGSNGVPGNAGGFNLSNAATLGINNPQATTVTKLVQADNSTVVNNSNQFTIGSWTWSGGTLTGGGTTTLGINGMGGVSTFNTSTGVPLSLSAHHVVNKGTVIWFGGGPIDATNSGWINSGGSTFEMRNNSTWFSMSTSGNFINEVGGVFKRTTGTGVATIAVPFFNSGTIQVDGGTLSLAGGLNGTPSSVGSGTYVIAGILRTPGLTVVDNTGNITLGGSQAALINDTTNLSALAGLNKNSGTLNITGGSSLDNNAPSFTNTGSLSVSKGAQFSQAGVYQQNGAGAVTVINGSMTAGAFVLQSGTLKGDGDLFSDLNNNGGRIAPGNSPGSIFIHGKYFQSGTFEEEIEGVLPGEFDVITVGGAITLGGALDVVLTYNAFIDDEFIIIDNQGVGDITTTFDLLPEGTNFNADGERFKITYKGGDGNDVALTRVATGIEFLQPGTPGVCSVVRNFTVAFNGLVPGVSAAAFKLEKLVSGAPVGSPVGIIVDTSASTVDKTIATLSFMPGAFVDNFDPNAGLADGHFRLTVMGNMLADPAGSQIDAGGTNIPGSSATNNFDRLYGDINCDGDVDGGDFLQFRLNFLNPTPNQGFDINGDGDVDGGDFLRFRLNFGHVIGP